MVVAGGNIVVSLGLNNMRASLVILGLAGLAACAPQVPDSGVGFQDYNSYLREREATASAAPTPTALPPAAPLTGFSTDSAAAAIDRADGGTDGGADGGTVTAQPVVPTQVAPAPDNSGVITDDRPRGNAPVGIQVESGEVAGTVSDEQDFEAVSARETIESDAARIERNRSQYVVIQPGALPVRPGETGPNIVEYALATNNAPGVALYSRSGSGKNAAANCAKYGSPDIAQQAFLESGGPDRDRKGLDPDGDGFACSWDPRPFRTALQ